MTDSPVVWAQTRAKATCTSRGYNYSSETRVRRLSTKMVLVHLLSTSISFRICSTIFIIRLDG